ncbi:MAG: hypothetical protein GEV13_00955 [Rhodospirillales bacterium]|nr:hypothetical protein [Rhodospirillales bacterium]
MIAAFSPTKSYSIQEALQCRGPAATFSQKAIEAVQPLGLPVAGRSPTQLTFQKLVDNYIFTGEVSHTNVVLEWKAYPTVSIAISAGGNLGSADQATVEQLAADIKGKLAADC